MTHLHLRANTGIEHIQELPRFQLKIIQGSYDDLDSGRLERELLALADKYDIAYGRDVNFCELEQEIAEHEAYLKKANFYGMKLNASYYDEVTKQHMVDAVDCWEKSLRDGISLGVNWCVGNYDPRGLDAAILAAEEGSNTARHQVNAYYYSTRGC